MSLERQCQHYLSANSMKSSQEVSQQSTPSPIKAMLKAILSYCRNQNYHNVPKFSDRHVWANSADPDRSSLIRVYTVCNFGHIFWVHYCLVKPSCSNFRVITANFLGVRIFRIFTVCRNQKYKFPDGFEINGSSM